MDSRVILPKCLAAAPPAPCSHARTHTLRPRSPEAAAAAEPRRPGARPGRAQGSRGEDDGRARSPGGPGTSGAGGPGAREERPPRPAALTHRLPGERAALLEPRAAADAALGCAPSGPSSSTEAAPQRATADGSARPARPLLAATRFGSGRPRPARAHSARAQTGQPAAARSPPPPPPPPDAHPARLPGAPRLLSARPPPRHTHTFSPFSELEHRSGREAAARGGRAQGGGRSARGGAAAPPGRLARFSPRPRLPAPLRSRLPPRGPGRDGHGRSSGAGRRTPTFGCRGPPGRGRPEYGGLGLPSGRGRHGSPARGPRAAPRAALQPCCPFLFLKRHWA